MLNRLVSPIDPGPLGFTRIVIGSAAAIRSLVALPVLFRLADPGFVTAPVFAWMPAPNRTLAVALVAIWLVSALLFAIGWRVPYTGAVLFACLVFLLALDLQAYSNHLYLMGLLVLLLVVADAGAGLSVERGRRPVPLWPVWLIMVQVSLVYGFSAITKLNEEFLTGRVLAGVLHGGLIPFPETLRAPGFLGVVAVVAVFTEVSLAFALWSRRLRPVAFVLGFGLHISITLLMADTVELLVFSMLMVSTYPLFAHTPLDQPISDLRSSP